MNEPFERMMQRLENIELVVGAIKRDSWLFLHFLLAAVVFISCQISNKLDVLIEQGKPEPKAMEPKP